MVEDELLGIGGFGVVGGDGGGEGVLERRRKGGRAAFDGLFGEGTSAAASGASIVVVVEVVVGVGAETVVAVEAEQGEVVSLQRVMQIMINIRDM